jgi:hypothetical protein
LQAKQYATKREKNTIGGCPGDFTYISFKSHADTSISVEEMGLEGVNCVLASRPWKNIHPLMTSRKTDHSINFHKKTFFISNHTLHILTVNGQNQVTQIGQKYVYCKYKFVKS